MVTTTKIVIGIDEQTIELKGADKEAFLSDKEQMETERLLLEALALEKDKARASALTKLGEIAGLTKEELDAIL
jgi:hypothetical protein